MRMRDALQWAVFYRVLATASFLLGMGFVTLGLYVGAPDTLSAITGTGTVLESLGSANYLVVVPLAVLGVLVWQLGSTVAYYRTLTEAIEMEMADRFDTERVKSDILEVLDDRLADMHTEIQETRRSIDDVKRSTSADDVTEGFDEL